MRSDAIATMLPMVYQHAIAGRTGPLVALLDVMEGLHEASEDQLAHVEDLFNPYRCPENLVAFLARWVSVDHLGVRRDLVAHGTALAQSRGTVAGLRAAIQLATGLTDVEVVEPADRPFHLVVRVPAASGLIETVRRIVELEKPAATTCEITPIGEPS